MMAEQPKEIGLGTLSPKGLDGKRHQKEISARETHMSIDELRAELAERIPDAAQEAQASHRTAMNSYGAGYDAGFVAALREISALLEGETI